MHPLEASRSIRIRGGDHWRLLDTGPGCGPASILTRSTSKVSIKFATHVPSPWAEDDMRGPWFQVWARSDIGGFDDATKGPRRA